MAGYDGGRVPALADLVLRTNAAPPCGPARRTTILPPAATLVICACRALTDRPGRHRAPRTTVPSATCGFPHSLASRLPRDPAGAGLCAMPGF
jgi:hypothetical protein